MHETKETRDKSDMQRPVAQAACRMARDHRLCSNAEYRLQAERSIVYVTTDFTRDAKKEVSACLMSEVEIKRRHEDVADGWRPVSALSLHTGPFFLSPLQGRLLHAKSGGR